MGCRASDWNCVALKPVVFMLVQSPPPLDERQTPPSLPNQTVLGFEGSISMAWLSAWRPV